MEDHFKNNGVNIWFGGTSLKTSELFRNKQNNCYILENFYKKEKPNPICTNFDQ